MSKESIVLLLGIVVLFVPHLGVPSDWKSYTLVATGVLLLVVGYLLRRDAYLRRIDRGNGERASESFVESSGGVTETPEESV